MKDSAKPVVDYSIVIPVYFNEGALAKTMATIKDDVILHHPSLCCEVIFVDDGSGDGSLDELIKLQKTYPEITKVIKFTRNYGQVNALLAGFSHARGKCVIAMSADGQDPPRLIRDMLKSHFEEHFEIVACSRQGRDESWYRILTSKLFYSLMRALAFPHLPAGGFDYVLLGRKALQTFLKNQEAHPFFQGQILWMGFKIKFIEYQRQKRDVGQSRWTLGKKVTYLIDGLLAYSFVPIRLMSLAGILSALLGFLYALVIIISKLVYGIAVKGWTPMMVVILLIGGLQMLMLGIIGEYLWRVLAQTRNRDPYVIEKIFDNVERAELGN